MDAVLSKKVNDLRRNILECFDYTYKQDKQERNSSEDLGLEVEIMDSIISSLSSLDILADTAEAELEDDTDTQYQLIDSMSQKQEALDFALKLKEEIVEKLYSDRKDLLKTHEDIAVDVTLEDDDVFESIISVLNYVDSKVNSLKNLLYVNEDLTFENLKKFVDSFEKFYDGFYDIYNSSIHDDNLESEINDIIEISDEDIEEYDHMEEVEEHADEFNYDTAMLDDIYITTFSEIKNEQRILIGIMASDYYEYHKLYQDMYSEECDEQKLKTLHFLEESNFEDLVNMFLQEPLFAFMLIDTYVYYNLSFSSDEKLRNREKINSISKLDILKKYNLFIQNDLKDQSLYNIFPTSISDYVRISTENLVCDIMFKDDNNFSDILLKYFFDDFTPENMNEIIPKEISEIDINFLKTLQLNFIISDCISDKLYNGNSELRKKLDENPNIIPIIMKDKSLLKIFFQYYEKNLDMLEHDLNSEDKKRIKKLNRFTIFDV